jgi:hypothetical protein
LGSDKAIEELAVVSFMHELVSLLVQALTVIVAG